MWLSFCFSVNVVGNIFGPLQCFCSSCAPKLNTLVCDYAAVTLGSLGRPSPCTGLPLTLMLGNVKPQSHVAMPFETDVCRMNQRFLGSKHGENLGNGECWTLTMLDDGTCQKNRPRPVARQRPRLEPSVQTACGSGAIPTRPPTPPPDYVCYTRQSHQSRQLGVVR